MPKAHPLRTEEQFVSAVQSDALTVLYFHATWCRPCQSIAPEYEKLAYQLPDVGFYKVDVDDLPDVVQNCGVRVLPTFLIVQKGKNVGSLTGADVPLLREFIDDAREGSLEAPQQLEPK